MRSQKKETRITPELLAVVVGKMNLSLMRKSMKREAWGGRNRSLASHMLSLKHALDI